MEVQCYSTLNVVLSLVPRSSVQCCVSGSETLWWVIQSKYALVDFYELQHIQFSEVRFILMVLAHLS